MYRCVAYDVRVLKAKVGQTTRKEEQIDLKSVHLKMEDEVVVVSGVVPYVDIILHRGRF